MESDSDFRFHTVELEARVTILSSDNKCQISVVPNHLLSEFIVEYSLEVSLVDFFLA